MECLDAVYTNTDTMEKPAEQVGDLRSTRIKA